MTAIIFLVEEDPEGGYVARAKQLLEIAKTGVEQAIEQDKATATTWIN